MITDRERQFFQNFGANTIWITPSKENVETILDIWSFIKKFDEDVLKLLV